MLGALSAWGVFAKTSSEKGLTDGQWLGSGVCLPILVTAVCMTSPVTNCFKWLCEPAFGGWLWREQEVETPRSDPGK